MKETEWFAQQIITYEQSMYRLAMSILNNTEDAADAAQEAILIAYQKLDTLRQKESFRPWLMKILTHECYRILRHRNEQIPLEEMEDSLPSTPGPEEERQLWQTVSELKPALRAAVVLYYYEGFNSREIGKILGITQTNVKTRLSRARKQMKLLLGESV